jgi:hypothetical protein
VSGQFGRASVLRSTLGFGKPSALAQGMKNDKFRVLEMPRKYEGSSGEQLLLRCGEMVRNSGIYEVVHGGGHAEVEGNTVVALSGEVVQPCNTCADEVQMRLLYEAPHVSEDPDFRRQAT